MTAMSGMSSTFSINTRVTLFFTEWTTTTPITYVLTIFFLFFLGLLNRFLGALKSQLERAFNKSRNTNNTLGLDDADSEAEPLSPMPYGQPSASAGHEEGMAVEKTKHQPERKRFWIASAPWHIKHDGLRALLEFVRALIGYILMLAIMTYNVGFLFAVTGSVLCGELVFGRFTQSGAGWQEGGCHE
ncbi:hypothetical protein K469DRAFT_595946 [Zopfia rhizophila CBS 207.26]|uniref:Copper transport protein n=1 Tax=Zopfia rhizophila CBS 207.26 TaxID=1314779 RepID=A0A6A6DNI4_9PEZI|nr:hypothetical protein K469DRAFT_595946 [Zopfia rhizophila CBS 207.26]